MDETTWKDYYKYEYPKFWVNRVKEYGFSRYHQIMQNLIDAKKGESVLECGIGTGEPFALRLARTGVNMFGIDLSQSLLDECKKNATKWNVDINCVVADIESMPFDDDSFDKTYCVSTTWYLPNLENALQEMFRVTKQGGIVMFDVINILHPTQAISYFTSMLMKNPWKARSPFQINRMLRGIRANCKVKGFKVLLPVSLPLLHDKANLCKFSDLFSYGLQDSALRYFGAKLVYVCKKDIYNG